MGSSAAYMAFALHTHTLLQESAPREVHLGLELLNFCKTFSPLEYVIINIQSRNDTASKDVKNSHLKQMSLCSNCTHRIGLCL